MKIILGLGTNLGNRQQNLESAIHLIGQRLLKNIRRSSVIETPPMLPANPPAEWNINFLNMAIMGEMKNEITPQEFLGKIKLIEKELGREQNAPRWSPRMIDIDILAWGGLIIDEPNLKIPHAGLLERDFARLPFAELAPEWKHPLTGENIGARS